MREGAKGGVYIRNRTEQEIRGISFMKKTIIEVIKFPHTFPSYYGIYTGLNQPVN